MKNTILVLFFYASVFQSLAQSHALEGKIIDAENTTPLAFCNVGIAGKAFGTLSNEKGEFVLKIPAKYANDSLQVSFVGYKTYKIAIASLPQNTLTISLTPTANTLKEVVVVNITGILEKALKKIKQNYQRNPVLMQGFYRETVKQPQSGNYFAFAEGVLEMYKAPINSNKDEVRMLKGRKKNLPFYFQQEGQICYIPKISNGPNIGILLDFVKDNRSFLLSSDYYYYKFNLEETTTIDDQEVYVVAFRPRNGGTIFEGKMYIDKATLAFVRAEYQLTDYGINKVNNMQNMDKRLILKERTYQVNYAKNKGIWYFHDAQVSNLYEHICQRVAIENQMNFVITQTEFDKVERFSWKDVIGLDESFNEQTMEFDDTFWKDYNIIKY